MAANFDPLGSNPNNGWAKGNFDGDDDIDIGDFVSVVRNFAPLGFSSTTLIVHESAVQSPLVSAAVETLSPISMSVEDGEESSRVATTRYEDRRLRRPVATVARVSPERPQPVLSADYSATSGWVVDDECAVDDGQDGTIKDGRISDDLGGKCRPCSSG